MAPRWKRWLSFITPITLEQTSSPHNPELSVVLDRGRLQLLSGNAIYSWDDLYRNFLVAFEQIDIRAKNDQHVLLLGLGLGSIPFMLEKHFGRRFTYTAVEHDEAVAGLAQRYTLSRLESPVDVVIADAAVFVDLCEESFDLIAIDIFQDDLVPPAFETPAFLMACKRLLRPEGTLLFNRLSNHQEQKRQTEVYFQQVFKKAFPQARAIDSRGNWVLCS